MDLNNFGGFSEVTVFASPLPKPSKEKFLGDPQQMNMYSYVANNPVNRVDPTGEAWVGAQNQQSQRSGLGKFFRSIFSRSQRKQSTSSSVENVNHLNTSISTREWSASPVGDAPINSPFGADRSSCSVCSDIHGGTDYKVDVGTPVYATASGTVDRSSYSTSYGDVVILNHGQAASDPTRNVYTLYAHGSSREVGLGQSVNVNDLIMYSGNSGENTTGPHLHYEVVVTPHSPNSSKFYGDLNIRHSPAELGDFIGVSE